MQSADTVISRDSAFIEQNQVEAIKTEKESHGSRQSHQMGHKQSRHSDLSKEDYDTPIQRSSGRSFSEQSSAHEASTGPCSDLRFPMFMARKY
ncbi:hypothetical protein R3I94_000806 [Phoxinus phoxinus]